MALNKAEYKWRKSVQREGDYPAVKGEACLPDERFAALDWRDYIEISNLYDESERELLTKMLDDVTHNIPEVRHLLRLTNDSLVHFEPVHKDWAESIVPAGQKILLKPCTDEMGLVGGKEERVTISSDEATDAFASNFMTKEIRFEPKLIPYLNIPDRHGNLQQSTMAEVFIHELIHQAMPSSPYEYLIESAIRTAWDEKIDEKLQNNQPLTQHEFQKMGEHAKWMVENRERLTVPLTNHIAQRYYGTIFRDADYMEALDVPKDFDATRYRMAKSSNLIPIEYIDVKNQLSKRVSARLQDVKQGDAGHYEKVEGRYVSMLQHRTRAAMQL